MRRSISLLLLILVGCAPSSKNIELATTTTPRTAALADMPGLETFSAESRPFSERPIVAVPNFTVRSNNLKFKGQELEGKDDAYFVELGSGVADILMSELYRSEQFRLTERMQLAQILFEQDLGQSGRVDKETAAEVGRITGAEVLIFGSVTEFSVSSTGGGGRFFGLLGGSAEIVTARITVDLRFVDAATAEIVAIGSSTAEASQGSVQVDVLNVIRGLQAGRTGTTIVDLAVRNAIIGAVNEGADDFFRSVQYSSKQ